jgi:hypothetical protein
VNGGLFSGSVETPRFSKIARSYLLHIGGLDWTKINPDIFGSMIQAVAEDEERGELGMHYTSVPNILKVLNPLFLTPPPSGACPCSLQLHPRTECIPSPRIRAFMPNDYNQRHCASARKQCCAHACTSLECNHIDLHGGLQNGIRYCAESR